MAGHSGFGTEFSINPDGLALQLIAGLTGISGPSLSLDTIDVSGHDSWKNGPLVLESVGIDTLTNEIVSSGHGLVDGSPVGFRAMEFPEGISEHIWYYVVNATADEFQIAKTPDGSPVVIETIGSLVDVYFAGAYREFTAGAIDPGEVSLEGNLLSTAQGNLLKECADTRVMVPMQIMFPTGDHFDFEGVVTGFETDAPFDDKLSFSATVKIEGKPILTSAI